MSDTRPTLADKLWQEMQSEAALRGLHRLAHRDRRFCEEAAASILAYWGLQEDRVAQVNPLWQIVYRSEPEESSFEYQSFRFSDERWDTVGFLVAYDTPHRCLYVSVSLKPQNDSDNKKGDRNHE